MTKFRETRNVGIIAHVDAGKTTLTERMLHLSGAVHRTGSVDDGTTTTDHDPLEQDKGITISSAAVHFDWRGYGVNLIDTPGHADFTIEVERSLRVLDGAVVLLDAVSGVQPQTEKVWRQADAHDVPRIVFVNKLDRPGASLDMCLDSLRIRLGVDPVVVGLPGPEGWVDVLAPSADPRRVALVEACAELDDDVAAAYLEDRPVSRAMLVQAVREGVRARRLLPVLAGSAVNDVGVAQALDAIVELLPAPRSVLADGPLAFCFKVVFPKFGQMSFLRVYAGSLRRGDAVWSSGQRRRVRVGRLVRLFGDRLDDVEVLESGAIGAVIGGGLRTGDTLSAPSAQVSLEGLEAPEPVVHLAIEPRRPSDRERLAQHLDRMLLEDPSLTRRTDPETGEALLGGVGQLHLEVTLARLRARSGVEVRVGRPKVALRSTVARVVERRHRHVKRTGGPGQFAEVLLRLEPLAVGAGFVFVDETRGGAVPAEYVAGVDKGVREALARGPLDGHPVVDVRVTLLDGATHSHDSSELAFKIAAQDCLREILAAADPVLLEPLAGLEVTAPDEVVGGIVGDLQRRRAVVDALDVVASGKRVRARVPLVELFGYAGDLASLSQGRAQHSAAPSGYAPAPRELQADLLKRAG
ncbi:MAG: elongation factor G [Deltaproteobacteria bacterium]|nr:elongation factor G [Deltaproteobacteria bacterium]